MSAEHDLLDQAPAEAEAAPGPWGALDCCARDLQRCPTPLAATRRFLQAARAALGADLVYCCSSKGPGPVEAAGVAAPPPWCQALAQYALAEAPGTKGQLLRAHW